MAALYFFLLALLCLSGVLGVEKDDTSSDIDVHEFLLRAHAMGIITVRQELELRNLARDLRGADVPRGGESSEGYSHVVSRVFQQTYNKFSLLNVLYFSGALLVMGAFTLFSTLAWTNFGYGGVTGVLTIPLLSSGYLGVRLWTGGSYPTLGGL